MLEARRWSAAAQAYARLADQTPDRAFMHRTFALQMTGRSERARETVEEAIKLHPGSGPLYALQAWLQLHGKRPEDALPLIAQARRSDMTREGLYVYAHGLISLALNDDETAAANFFRAAELLPNHAFAQVRVARLYRAAGETDKALHAYRAAADAAHTDVQVWAELALAMEGADQLNGAVGTLRRALQNNPANPHVARSLAGLLMQQGNYDAARKVLAGAAEAAACNPDLHKDHGDAARTMWKLEEAAEAYRTAMRIAQNPHPAAVKLAHIHRVRREYRDAADRLADVLADEATGPALRASALIEKAQLLVEAGSAEQAVALLQEAAGLAGGEGDGGPALVEAYLAIGTPQATDAALRHAQLAIAARDSSTNRAALARALLAAGNPDKALEAAESALQADKHCRTALRTAAEAHLAGDDTEAARRSVERALELNPYDEDALRLLGHVELQADRPSKCVEAWRDALDINPWDGALHRMLAEVLSTDLDEREAALHHIDRSAELRKARESFQPE
jgi:tetratricopeptide (TPR) repeat protein